MRIDVSFPALVLMLMLMGLHPSVLPAAGIWFVLGGVAGLLALHAFRQPLVTGVVLQRAQAMLTLYSQGQARKIPFSAVRCLVVHRLEAGPYEALLECEDDTVVMTTGPDLFELENWARQLSQTLGVACRLREVRK